MDIDCVIKYKVKEVHMVRIKETGSSYIVAHSPAQSRDYLTELNLLLIHTVQV